MKALQFPSFLASPFDLNESIVTFHQPLTDPTLALPVEMIWSIQNANCVELPPELIALLPDRLAGVRHPDVNLVVRFPRPAYLCLDYRFNFPDREHGTTRLIAEWGTWPGDAELPQFDQVYDGAYCAGSLELYAPDFLQFWTSTPKAFCEVYVQLHLGDLFTAEILHN